MRTRNVPVGPAIIGGVFAALTFAVPKLAVISSVPFVAALQNIGMGLVTPGLVGAFISARNIHAAPLWIAAVGNFGLYSCVAWIAMTVWHRARPHRLRKRC